jgi:hypothetical protein
MANRTLKPLRGNGNGTKVYTFQIAPNGTGTPTIADNPDKVVSSVSRSGVGVYVVTLTEKHLALRSIHVQVQLSAAANTFVQVTGAPTISGAKQITTTILTAGVAADIAANAANVLHYTLVLKDGGGQ